MKTLKDFKRELLANPAARVEYEAQSAEFTMTRELIAARSRAGLTQGEIAQRMGTTQSVIARLEGGKRQPSIHANRSTLRQSHRLPRRGAPRAASWLNRFAPASPTSKPG